MKRLRRGLLVLLLLGCAGAWLGLLWLERAYSDPPYALVEDGLYVGSATDEPPPGTRAVVNLCGREDRYATEACLWEPVSEGGPEPSIEWLRRVVGFIAAQRAAGRPTYVHCLAGMNRSGAVVTAYLMYEHGWGRDEALGFVRSRRPQVQPNPALMRLLTEWEQALKAQATSEGQEGWGTTGGDRP
jgi:hypothetical protein